MENPYVGSQAASAPRVFNKRDGIEVDSQILWSKQISLVEGGL
jgi:hypothetical protein